MHRVVSLLAIGTDPEEIEQMKLTIRDQLDSYDTHTAEVNDGADMEGNPTLAVSVDFNNSTEANSFHAWLQDYIVAHRDSLTFAQTRIHDCNHAAGENLPCRIGDIWRLT